MGFPPGTALNIMVQAFKKYESRAKKTNETRLLEYTRSKCAPPAKVAPPAKIAPLAKIVDVTDSYDVHDANVKVAQLQPVPKCSSTAKPASSSPAQQAPQSSNGTESSAVEKMEEDVQPAADKTTDKDEDDNPELTRVQKEFQACPESYNGARRENYSWSQTITDADVLVKVPPYIKRGKEVYVQIARKHLIVRHKAIEGGWTCIVDTDLTWDVNKEESMWSLIPGKHVQISLEKVQERWWEALLEGEDKISVRKIDASRPITDLDDEAAAKVEEMMFNEHQKRVGKPQSHEVKVHSMLKDAWNAEGSPFKGTEFDPSKMNISPSGDGGSTIDFKQ